MELLFDIAGFFGSWLLVMGPIFQASLELDDQDLQIDHMREVRKSLPEPRKVSFWWWFVPPIKIYLTHKSNDEYRHQYASALDPEDLQSLFEFRSKALGWVMVAVGGFLLASKETFELSVHFDIPGVVVWPVIVTMALLSVGYTVNATRRRHRLETKHGITKKR